MHQPRVFHHRAYALLAVVGALQSAVTALALAPGDTVSAVALPGADRPATQDGACAPPPAHHARRVHGSRQGDSVNSTPWYVGAPAGRYFPSSYRTFARRHAQRLHMLYVGGNDGMLHGFSALDGSEKMTYLPQGMAGPLPRGPKSSDAHRPDIAGSPFSGDVNTGSEQAPDWRTLLVGSLGAGGKGYFVLDVTQPDSTAHAASTTPASQFPVDRVVLDKTAPADGAANDTASAADIGHIFAKPVTRDNQPHASAQIARLNNGRWAAVMGNGYYSHNQRPVLLIQYLDGARELLPLIAAHSGPDARDNGLSAPRLVDLVGDGTPDLVYAGDLHGNLWKFDIAATDPQRWGIAFQGRPLYTATHASPQGRRPQPITAAPAVKSHDRGGHGLMVAFGTGHHLTESDGSDHAPINTLYAVLDRTAYRIDAGELVVDTSAGAAQPLGTGSERLVEQTVNEAALAGQGHSAGRTFWRVSQNHVDYADPSEAPGDARHPAHQGWFLQLPVAGERLLEHLSFYDASNLLEVLTKVPAPDSSRQPADCPSSATLPTRYRTFLNIMDGKKPRSQTIDRNGDGLYDSLDGGVSRMTAAPRESRHSDRHHEIRRGEDGSLDRFARQPEQVLRPSWRQLR